MSLPWNLNDETGVAMRNIIYELHLLCGQAGHSAVSGFQRRVSQVQTEDGQPDIG